MKKINLFKTIQIGLFLFQTYGCSARQDKSPVPQETTPTVLATTPAEDVVVDENKATLPVEENVPATENAKVQDEPPAKAQESIQKTNPEDLTNTTGDKKADDQGILAMILPEEPALIETVNPVEEKKETPAVVTKNTRDEINQYFKQVTDWNSIVKNKESGNDLIPGTEVRDENGLQATPDGKTIPVLCESADYNLTTNPEEIVMKDPNPGILYPGALIQGEGYMQGPGGLKELALRQRAPIKVAMNSSNINNTVTVQEVDYAGYQRAYSELIQNAKKDNVDLGIKAVFKEQQSNSAQQAALNAGLSVKFLGNSVKASFDKNSNVQESTFIAVYQENAFTISAVTPSTPADFFNKDFSLRDLKDQEFFGNISPKNVPLYVSSVNYGKMLIVIIKSKACKTDIKAAIDADVRVGVVKADASAEARLKNIRNEMDVQAIGIGGSKEEAYAAIKSGNVKDYFNNDKRIESYVPISYVVRNIKDNSIATISETTRYTVKNCSPKPIKARKIKLTIKRIEMKYTGGDDRGEVYGELSLNNQILWSRASNQYVRTKNGADLETNLNQRSKEFTLNYEKCEPVKLKAHFKDYDDALFDKVDDELAEFDEGIGCDDNGRILMDTHKHATDPSQDQMYSVDSQKNVKIHYTIETIENYYK